METSERVAGIIAALKQEYPDALCALHYGKDYELMIAVRLSAQCTDARVNLVTPALFARYPTLDAFAEADVAEVEGYVHSCGFYKHKAEDIVLACRMLRDEYGGKVPGTMEQLLRLPGDAAVFAPDEASAIPVWAQSAVSALSNVGIPLAASDYEAPLTRREAANMLLAAAPAAEAAGLYWSE